MVQLIELLILKPLNGIVAGLSVIVVYMMLSLFTAHEAIAVINVKQKSNREADEVVHSLVYEMNSILLRVDENVSHMVDNHFSEVHHGEPK